MTISNPLKAAELLERIVDGHAAGTIDPVDLETVIDACAKVLDGEAETLDQALGLSSHPGQASWRTILARSRRDRLLKEAAARFFAGKPVTVQADRLAAGLRRYAYSAWYRDRVSNRCPARHNGRIEEAFWHILTVRERALSARQIERILDNC